MEWNQIVWLVLYYGALALLCCYGVHRYLMLILYYKYKHRPLPAPRRFSQLPRLTIQLPIYNEMYVVERLLHAVCSLRYPRNRLQIQILDDSTDETREICAGLLQEYRGKGFDISHLTRPSRTGFKAGALEHGLQFATGDYIAIFDADFVPQPDLLEKMIHYFTDSRIGMIQSRWGHINEDYSILTKVQSMLLDGHFLIEQTARSRSGRFFNFNGTAGIWRRECIESAGGWSGDTLAEDLDLSYRAQLQGWKFLYLPEVVTAAELPVEMNGFKTQQHRWAKGSVQTCKKILPVLWQSPLPFKIKVEGTVHLTSNLAYLPLLLLCFLLNPHLMHPPRETWWRLVLIDLPIFFAASVSVILFYVCAQRELHRDWKRRLLLVPLLMAVGIGLSINNAKAVIEAVFNHRTSFTRTPKYGLVKERVAWREKRYRAIKQMLPWIELACGAYVTYFVILAIQNRAWGAIPFMALFQIGFLYVAFMSIFQQLGFKEPKPAEATMFDAIGV
jgi:cellulose synthase/poly-beta-1,6-N-acetylglucosamine synthase-like glycosyltransferase